MRQSNQTEVLLKILLWWYTFVFFSLQALSIFNLVNQSSIYISQTIFFIFLYKIKIIPKIEWRFSKINLLIGILLLLTFVQGFLSAPNTSDSMSYHLPRVIHWIQNRSVFQSEILNDHDYMTPFGEYLDLILYQIQNNDRFVFLSQWLSFIGCILTAGLISKALGGSKSTQNIVKLSVATIPMVVMQSTSTQTDLLTSFLLLMSIYFSIKVFNEFKWVDFTYFLVCCCLGFLTKPSFAIFAIIPVGLVIWRLANNRKNIYLHGLKILIFSMIVPLLFLFGFVHQNLVLYGSPLGHHLTSNGELTFTNEQFTASFFVSNLIRNIFLQLPVPFFSSQVQDMIVQIHNFLGIDLNDPKTTWIGTKFQVRSIIYPQEDLVANPLQLILFLIAIISYFRSPKKKLLITYLFISIIISFGLFCLILKWQPWHSRLHLPLFTFATVISVLILYRYKFLINLFLGLSYSLAIVVIFLNVSRPLISYQLVAPLAQKYSEGYTLPESIFINPRIKQYFNSKPSWYIPYQLMAKEIKKTNPLTLKISAIDGLEYPIFVLMKQEGYLPRIQNSRYDTLFYTSKILDSKYQNQKCFKTTPDYGFACLVKIK